MITKDDKEVKTIKTPTSIAKRGWVVVDEADYSTLPKQVAEKFRHSMYQKPVTAQSRVALWQKIERLFYKYSRRLSEQFNVEFEDLSQEAYIFFDQLIESYKPLYFRPMRPSDLTEDEKKFCRIYTYDANGNGWAYKLYKLEPYLCKNMYQKIRHFAQTTAKYNRRLYASDSRSESPSEALFDNAVHHQTDSMVETEDSYLKVERKLLNESLKNVLDEIIVDYRSTKRQVAELFFKEGKSENEIYKILDKSPCTINSHISRIKSHLRGHQKVLQMLAEFSDLGITYDEILGT